MKIKPYKFLIVLPKIEKQYRWNRYYVRKEHEQASYGVIVQLGARTRRIDLPGRSFYGRRWLREMFAAAFPKAKIGYVKASSTIVAMWTNDPYWLADPRVWKTMEVWSGDREADALWKANGRSPAGSRRNQ